MPFYQAEPDMVIGILRQLNLKVVISPFNSDVIMHMESGPRRKIAGQTDTSSANAFAKVRKTTLYTLMRKAAKIGGVHPVYIDRLSSEFARKIETTSLPFSVVGQRCGIYDNNYFMKILKKYTTSTPKQFRAQSSHFKNI